MRRRAWHSCSVQRDNGGVALWEALLALGLIALLLLFLVPIFSSVSSHRPGHGCRSQLRGNYMGVRVYLNSYDEFLPLAWHVAGSSVAEDLSNLTYWRLAIQSFRDAGYSRIVTPTELAACRGDALAARRAKYRSNSYSWTDPSRGWTNDYFAPDMIFRWPAGSHVSKPADYSTLVADLPATQRPLIADVNASLPNPDAKDPDDPEHEAEMRNGFGFVRESGVDVFVGVGPSLRHPGNLATSRLDFRHSGAANVIFLDGHVDLIPKGDAARLEKVHRAWNHLRPSPD